MVEAVWFVSGRRQTTVDGGKSSPPFKKNQKEKKEKLIISIFFEIFEFQFFHVTPLNFPRLIAKTASPGPTVSVPTPGSWEKL